MKKWIKSIVPMIALGALFVGCTPSEQPAAATTGDGAPATTGDANKPGGPEKGNMDPNTKTDVPMGTGKPDSTGTTSSNTTDEDQKAAEDAKIKAAQDSARPKTDTVASAPGTTDADKEAAADAAAKEAKEKQDKPSGG